ncbi:uncharacterized protein HMPREF1541_04663 [Cyphellophora europaea CBS 101466]|uniref:NmrA-like domain-containing protein n=1 Tax=Cyphellophora europaea (strain CBS 101466) TaxID=1220924 RepID=W2RV71_CYPE1|nr:uncharacterized protein HMPREF1541_04663 [Cyphellophora europaea CBS 101466]ETN40386.1 hypothetical protein HMPREF1541_04663 [Cyphellophora europaea CBS 101466]
MAPRLIAVVGATGTQGGAVARLLLQWPEEYRVRAITRNTTSEAAEALLSAGAEVFQADQNDEDQMNDAFEGCWGVFAVTTSYDPAVIKRPELEEEHGRTMARAASRSGVECYVWSTLPSSKQLTRGEVEARIYDSKHLVDAYIQELGLPSTFILTATFYENLITRKHAVYIKDEDRIEFRHPVIEEDTGLQMVWIEKDLSAIVKAVLDEWDAKKDELNHQYLFASSGRVTYSDLVHLIQKVSGKPTKYVLETSSGIPERDKLFKMYNRFKQNYPGFVAPDPQVLALGVRLAEPEDFVRERILPALGL